jgi:hypothetical protein
VSLEVSQSIAAILLEATVVALLIYRRVHRIVPIFCLFLIWTIVSDSTMTFLSKYLGGTSPRYYQSYMIETSVEFLFEFAVLVELSWSVLRPIRSALSPRTIVGISALLLLVGAAVWPIAGRLTLAGPTHQWHIVMQMQQTFSILRVGFVLVLAGFSQLLAIGWRDRELQVATGLGFFSLMAMGASILHTHHQTVTEYHNVDLILGLSYLCSLAYWIFSFAQQEAPRQEFSPKMENFLLAVSGAARADRIALEQIRKSGK